VIFSNDSSVDYDTDDDNVERDDDDINFEMTFVLNIQFL
jgi:hypothetical protein